MATKRTILYFTIDPETRNRYRAVAALKGKSLKDWALEALEEKADRDLKIETNLPEEGDLARALRLIDALSPVIKAGTTGKTDAVSELQALRDERLDSIGKSAAGR